MTLSINGGVWKHHFRYSDPKLQNVVSPIAISGVTCFTFTHGVSNPHSGGSRGVTKVGVSGHQKWMQLGTPTFGVSGRIFFYSVVEIVKQVN